MPRSRWIGPVRSILLRVYVGYNSSRVFANWLRPHRNFWKTLFVSLLP